MNVIESSKWKKRFLRMAYQAASWSKDTSTQVGATITTMDGHPRSFGFNGFPIGVNDDVPERHERPEKYQWFEHAERNALYLSDSSLKGCILFITHLPCPDCTRGIIQKGIKYVVVDKYNEGGIKREFWEDKYKISLTMMEEAGIVLETVYADVTLSRLDGELFVVPRGKFPK